MRNLFASAADNRSIPRPRGGSVWINLLGRDWIVRRRKPTKLGIIGTALGCLGVGGIMWGSWEDFKPDRVGIAFLMVGITLICFKRLETKNLAADEIYNVGRERGEADGYDQGYLDGVRWGERNRPVVVPFPSHCTCGNPECSQPAGVVADRG